MFRFFKRKEVPFSIDLIDFNANEVSTGQVGEYILNLCESYGFRHIGYRFEHINGSNRIILYTLANNYIPIQFFKDRCPGMIEEACQSLKGIPHKFITWDNGFSEVGFADI